MYICFLIVNVKQYTHYQLILLQVKYFFMIFIEQIISPKCTNTFYAHLRARRKRVLLFSLVPFTVYKLVIERVQNENEPMLFQIKRFLRDGRYYDYTHVDNDANGCCNRRRRQRRRDRIPFLWYFFLLFFSETNECNSDMYIRVYIIRARTTE